MNKEMTPKERYDAEMKAINKTLNPAPEKEAGFSDEEVDELEQEVEEFDEVIDKSMGDTKISVTQEQFQKDQEMKNTKEILNTISQAGALRLEKLNPEDEEKIQKLLQLERDGKLSDPVLKHFISKKVKLAQEKVQLDIKAKEIQQKLVVEFGKLGKATLKCINSMNTFNQEILSYLEENPDAFKEV